MNWTEDQYQDYVKSRGKDIETKDKAPKKAKYNNKHVRVDGIVFDSGKEAEYYNTLKLLMRAGAISGFCMQPAFVLVEGNDTEKAITYSADFIVLKPDGTYEIVDTKGYETEQWKRTYKMFRLKYPELELKVIK
jgi:protein associated with RNAse G/E